MNRITIAPMKPQAATQRDRVIATLRKRGMARLSEFKREGITAATVSRLERQGAVLRLGRGLYQLPDAPTETHHTLAEAAKLVPKGVVCLVSALAYHELTDRIPRQVWMAIGPKDWLPRIDRPRIRFVRFSPRALASDVEVHMIEGVSVRITTPARTVIDLFRYRRSIGINAAIEGAKAALRERKATPAEIARRAEEAGVWRVVQPYIEALTING